MTAAQPRFCTSFTVGGTTYRHSNEDFYDDSDNFYEGTLLEYPDLRSRYQERNWGTYERETIRLIYGNADGAWYTLIGAQELRDVDISLQNYDMETGGSPTTVAIAQIVSVDVKEQVTIVAELRRFDVLETLIPTKVIGTGDFAYANDLGAAINILSGQVKAVPLRYIFYDTSNDYYDYLICEPGTNQTVSSCDTVYRDGRTVNPADYTFYDGSQGSPHGGYAFIRFALEQKDFDDRLYTLTADITMASRDFSDIIKEILTDTTWGLSETVNAASFATAKTALTGIGSMYCDGAVTVQKKARDVIEDLLAMCRGHLYQNTSGEWVLIIDNAYDGTSSATFGFEDGIYNNILEIKERIATPADQALKSITLKYGRQADGSELIYENTRSVFGFGKDEIVRTDWVNNHTTADKYTAWRKQMALYSDEGMVIVVGEDGRGLDVGDRITIDIPDWGIDEDLYRIEDKTDRESTFEFVIKEYQSSIYTYGAGSMPSSANSSLGTMWGVGDVKLPSDETLIAEWKFDIGKGRTAIDLSGYGHHGVIYNSPSVIYGVSGYALDFDDTNSEYISVPDSDVLDDVACFEAWVNPQTYHAAGSAAYHIIISKHASNKFGLYIDYSKNPNEFVAIFEDSNGTTSTASAAVFDTYGQFFHIVGQVNPTLNGAEIFINGGRMDYDAAGALIDVDGNGTDKSGAPVLIAGGIANRYSRIAVDCIRLYDSNLEPGEIRARWLNRGGESSIAEEQALVSSGKALPGDQELVGYWDCNDIGDSTRIADNSGYGQDLSGSSITFVDGVSGDAIDGNDALTGTPASGLATAIKSGSFSISFWWEPKEELDYAKIISFDTNAGADTVFVQHSNDNATHASLSFGYYKDGSNYFYGYIGTSAALFSYDTMYHIILVHDRTNDLLKLYVDSVEYELTMASAGDGASGFPTFTSCTEISFFPAGNLDDYLDQIRIYNKVLSDTPNPGSEINGLWSIPAGSPKKYKVYNIEDDETFQLQEGGYINIFGSGSNQGSMYASGDIWYFIWSDGVETLAFKMDTSIPQFTWTGNIIPESDNTFYFGSELYSWLGIYAYGYYDEGGDPIDDEPDLEILQSLWDDAIEIDGKKKHNLIACPDFLTNKAALREKAKREKGIKTEEEFEALLKDPKEVKYTLKRNISTNLDLTQGTVRELSRKLDREIFNLRSEIDKIKEKK